MFVDVGKVAGVEGMAIIHGTGGTRRSLQATG
jgi:hypothetical protein